MVMLTGRGLEFESRQFGRGDLPLHGGVGVDGDHRHVVVHVVREERLRCAIASVQVAQLRVVLLRVSVDTGGHLSSSVVLRHDTIINIFQFVDRCRITRRRKFMLRKSIPLKFQ